MPIMSQIIIPMIRQHHISKGTGGAVGAAVGGGGDVNTQK